MEMSFAQNLAERVLPERLFQRVKSVSECWMIQCTQCGSQRSVWSIGGIRFGAYSREKRLAAHCSKCDTTVAAKVYFQESPE
jgi:hypothetical protein